MKKVILYVATSLDGYIARKNGSVDWLTRYSKLGEDFGYKKFLDSIGTIILGNTTYEEFKAPYKNKKCFVFSRKNTGKKDNITFVNDNAKEFIEGLDDENIWLVGGANIAKDFLKNNLVDDCIITIMPIILGEGIPLFSKGCGKHNLKLLTTKSFDSGVVQLHYTVDLHMKKEIS
ncbi:MAG: dihydrofolate reductase family protein [Nitrosopumilus sp.]|nr:dihydrofolate reductase family protein [Nitrosopumilus sp.]MDH3384601.1 dihydrofolate reductase family protein [Nitrosopumilus sp.]